MGVSFQGAWFASNTAYGILSRAIIWRLSCRFLSRTILDQHISRYLYKSPIMPSAPPPPPPPPPTARFQGKLCERWRLLFLTLYLLSLFALRQVLHYANVISLCIQESTIVGSKTGPRVGRMQRLFANFARNCALVTVLQPFPLLSAGGGKTTCCKGANSGGPNMIMKILLPSWVH